MRVWRERAGFAAVVVMLAVGVFNLIDSSVDALFADAHTTGDYDPPGAVNLVVTVREDYGGKCYGTPISSDRLVTAQHVASDAVSWEALYGTGHGKLERFWKSETHDIGVMSGQFTAWASFDSKLPAQGSMLYWRMYLPGPHNDVVPIVTGGRYMGLDGYGHGHLAGIAHPGASGSGVFDVRGKLVGVIVSGYIPPSSDVIPSTIQGVIAWLHRADNFVPTTRFVPAERILRK